MGTKEVIILMGIAIFAIIVICLIEADAFKQKEEKPARKKNGKQRKRKKKYQDYIEAAWNEINN